MTDKPLLHQSKSAWREGLPQLGAVRYDKHGQAWRVTSIERAAGKGKVTLAPIPPEYRTVPVEEFDAMSERP